MADLILTAPGEEEIGLRRAPRIREDEVRQHQARAEDAAKKLQAQSANALTREQFEQRLREVLSKALRENVAVRRRVTPGDKSGR